MTDEQVLIKVDKKDMSYLEFCYEEQCQDNREICEVCRLAAGVPSTAVSRFDKYTVTLREYPCFQEH